MEQVRAFTLLESQAREYFYNKKQRHDGFYRFGCVGYDRKGNVVLESIDVRVLLTDEEYLTLLNYRNDNKYLNNY